MDESERKDRKDRKESILEATKDFIYGFTAHGMAVYALMLSVRMESLFMLTTLGDMLGIPILPHYYRLRLLPHAMPRLWAWKQALLRERDITDAIYY